MKQSIVLAIASILLFTSCYTAGKCPTTNPRYFTKGIKGGKVLYKGYPSYRGNQSFVNINRNR